MAREVIASGSRRRTVAAALSLAVAVAAIAGGAFWGLRGAAPATPSGAVGVRDAELGPRQERPRRIETATQVARPIADETAVVPAAFTTRPALTAAPPLPARSFEGEEQELTFWRERAPGEALTLEGLETSEAALTRVLEAGDATKSTDRGSLEERREVLRMKLAAQRARVEQMEARVAELERVRGSK